MCTATKKELPAPTFMGHHSAAPRLIVEKYKDVPYLKENEGKLPPFILAFGNRLRVEEAIEVLKLKNTIRLDELGRQLFGREGAGRSNIAIGTYEKDDKPVPILLLEHQMGAPPVQIFFREIWALTLPSGTYFFEGHQITVDAISTIRNGSCGAANILGADGRPQGQIIETGDALVTSNSIGNMGPMYQALGIPNPFADGAKERYQRLMREMGFEFTDNSYAEFGEFAITPCDAVLTGAINSSAIGLGLRTALVRNIAKDGLYLEEARTEDGQLVFPLLAQHYGVQGSEMEQTQINFEARWIERYHGIRVRTAMIATALGVIPEGFATGEDAARKIVGTNEKTLIASANAFQIIAYGSS